MWQVSKYSVYFLFLFVFIQLAFILSLSPILIDAFPLFFTSPFLYLFWDSSVFLDKNADIINNLKTSYFGIWLIINNPSKKKKKTNVYFHKREQYSIINSYY